MQKFNYPVFVRIKIAMHAFLVEEDISKTYYSKCCNWQINFQWQAGVQASAN